MLGNLRAAAIGKGRDRGEPDDRTHARDRFVDRIAPPARAFAETWAERANPLASLAPYCIVMAHMLFEFFGDDAPSAFLATTTWSGTLCSW